MSVKLHTELSHVIKILLKQLLFFVIMFHLSKLPFLQTFQYFHCTLAQGADGDLENL